VSCLRHILNSSHPLTDAPYSPYKSFGVNLR
jgi:hypothetical protein